MFSGSARESPLVAWIYGFSPRIYTKLVGYLGVYQGPACKLGQFSICKLIAFNLANPLSYLKSIEQLKRVIRSGDLLIMQSIIDYR